MVDRLQTGDVAKEGWSGEASEDDDGVTAFHLFLEGEGGSFGVIGGDFGHLFVTGELGGGGSGDDQVDNRYFGKEQEEKKGIADFHF